MNGLQFFLSGRIHKVRYHAISAANLCNKSQNFVVTAEIIYKTGCKSSTSA